MSTVVLQGKVRIPDTVVDLASFRQWARSDNYPQTGWFSYLHGEVWVDLRMEQAFSHNLVKTAFTVRLGGVVEAENSGYLFSDRMLLSNVRADLSTEPDGMFVSWDAVNTGRVRLVPGAEGGFVEIEGSPEMVLEVVSDSSERKDTVELRELYWRAGVAEYWLVDARGETARFEILRWAPDGYVAAQQADGWVASEVFKRSFRLLRTTDQLGHPQLALEVG